jgi:WD40 repeat protein
MIAIVRGSSISVHDLESPGGEPARVEHGNAHRAELSPSGRWLVTTTWHGSEVRVWNARLATLIAAFPSRSAHARWSPDERWLAVATESGFSLHETGTWRIRYRLGREGGGDMPGTIAFSSDSRLVALVRSPTRVNLHWTETGEEAVSLQPLGGYGGWMELSPDGGHLAMAAPTFQAVKLWNLTAIRGELAVLGLDWDRRVPEVMESPAPGILRTEYGAAAPEVDSGSPHARARDLNLLEAATRWLESAPDPDLLAARAEVHRRLGSLEEALADLDSLVDLQRERFAAGSLSGRDGLAGALRARADLRAETGRVEEAIDDLVSVVKIDADRGSRHDNFP